MKFCNSSVICIAFILINYIIIITTISCAQNSTNSINSNNNNNTLNLYITENIFNEIKDPVEIYKNIHSRKCLHFKKNYQKNYLGSFSQRKSHLAYLSEVPFEPLRIHFDYSLTLPHEEKMIKELIIPPVKKFFENTLSVRRIIGKIRFPKSLKSCQDVPIPSFLFSLGVQADLVIIVSTYRGIKKNQYDKYMESLSKNNIKYNNSTEFSKNDNNLNSYGNNINKNDHTSDSHILNNFLKKFFKSKQYKKSTLNQSKNKKNTYDNPNNINNSNNYNNDDSSKSKPKVLPWEINDGPSDVVGWSATCLQDLYTLRPIAGVMQYVADINPTPRAIEEAIWTTLHEITHVLAMDYDLMGDFIDENFSRKGYENILKIKTKLVGLADLMQERQEVMNDYFAFVNFNETDKNNKNIRNRLKDLNEQNENSSKNLKKIINKASKSQKSSFRRDLDFEKKISEFDKMIFKQVELNTNNDDDVPDSEDISESNSQEVSNFDTHSLNNIENEDENKKVNNNKADIIDKPKDTNFKKPEEESKNQFNIKFNKRKKLRLKDFNLFKEDIIEDYKKKLKKKEDREKIGDKQEIKKDFNIGFNHGITKIFLRTLSEIKKEKTEVKSYLVLPEEKISYNNSILKNFSLLNSTLNSPKSNKNESLNYSNKTKSEEADEDLLFTDNLASIFPDSSSNDLFITLQKLHKLIKIKMQIQENYEEIKVPPNFNLTVLLMYIENFSENTQIFLKTTKVLEAGKKHFFCEALEGIELEYFGGIGSAYSHWSKRILNTEFMIADSYGENYISNFTLALMEDSGWYKVDYTKSQDIPWGKAKGCEFLEEKCIRRMQAKSIFSSFTADEINNNNHSNNNNSFSLASNNNASPHYSNPTDQQQLSTNNFNLNLKSNNDNNYIFDSKFPEEFCATVNEEECSITHIFRAVCGLNKYSEGEEIPKQFQYFGDPRIAGISPFGDYCPYPVEWFDAVQMKPVGSCKNGLQLRPGLGESICENCRCFISSLVNQSLYEKEIKSKVKNYRNLDENRAACYEARCIIEKNNKLRLVVFVEDNEIKCPRNGGILTIEGYKGFITCPKAEQVCFGVMDPRRDSVNVSANGLFSHLSEKLLNIMYDFVYSFFNDN